MCAMFVRTKTTPNSPRKSVQIVECVREDGKVKQKIVKHVGIADDEKELSQLKDLAEYLKAELEHQEDPNLFAAKDMAEMAIASRPVEEEKELNVDLKKLREERRVVVGFHDIYGQVYHELGFDYCLKNPARKVAASRDLRHIVMARIARPGSKMSSVWELDQNFGVSLSLDGVYRMMDHLDDEAITRINRSTHDAAQRLFGDKMRVVFYDCTTLYFEAFDEDELQQKGFSKDMKYNQTQVLLALVVTQEGIPVSYELFPGATFEGNTLAKMLERIKNEWQPEELVIVADSALLSEKNRDLLDSQGVKYIVGVKLKTLNEELTNQVLSENGYSTVCNEVFDKVKDLAFGEMRLIVSRNPDRAKKEAHDRNESIEKLKKKLKKSKNPTDLISNFGYRKFLKIEGEAHVVINEEKMAAAAVWDGLHGVVTNIKDMSPTEIVGQYHGLWQIEDCFRVSKHDLQIRPIFHWTPRRIKAHVAICFMALACVKHLMYRIKLQKHRMSAEVIRRALNSVQVSILRHTTLDQRYAVPSRYLPEAHDIYKAFGKPLSDIPYQLLS